MSLVNRLLYTHLRPFATIFGKYFRWSKYEFSKSINKKIKDEEDKYHDDMAIKHALSYYK